MVRVAWCATTPACGTTCPHCCWLVRRGPSRCVSGRSQAATTGRGGGWVWEWRRATGRVLPVGTRQHNAATLLHPWHGRGSAQPPSSFSTRNGWQAPRSSTAAPVAAASSCACCQWRLLAVRAGCSRYRTASTKKTMAVAWGKCFGLISGRTVMAKCLEATKRDARGRG